MPNKPCPFCEFDICTEIFYYDKWRNLIICRDKKGLGFKYRLLGVRVGVEHHKKIPTFEEREEVLTPLIAVAEAQVRSGMVEEYDVEEIVGEEHYHYYCNIVPKNSTHLK